MRIFASDQLVDGRMTSLLVEHLGEIIHWDATPYNKMLITNVEETFELLNLYWSALSVTRQNQLFKIYKDINGIFREDLDNRQYVGFLISEIGKIYELMPYEELSEFIRKKVPMRYPSQLKDTYSPDFNDEQNYRDRTYLLNDYIELVIYALAIRAMVPIWGQYMPRAASEFGQNQKELACIKLLPKAWVNDCKAKEKLLTFIELSSSNDNENYGAILEWHGTAGLPNLRLSLALVRRISMGKLSSIDDKDSLVSNVYNYFSGDSNFNSLGRRFGGIVVDKFRRGKNERDADGTNTSRAEYYRLREPLSGGDKVMLNAYTESALEMMRKVDPSVDRIGMQNIKASLRIIDSLAELEIPKHAKLISGWIMNVAITGKATGNLQKLALLRKVICTQCILWNWGMYDLAALMTASPFLVEDDEDAFPNNISRKGVTKENKDILVAMYPHYMRTNTQNKEQLERQQQTNNQALKDIDRLTRELIVSDWVIHATPELTKLSCTGQYNNRMIIPANIKNQLAELIIKMNTRSEWLPEVNANS